MEANYFTILWWFWPYIDMNQSQVHVSLHPEPLSQLPPHPITLGCPRTLAKALILTAFFVPLFSIYDALLTIEEARICLDFTYDYVEFPTTFKT